MNKHPLCAAGTEQLRDYPCGQYWDEMRIRLHRGGGGRVLLKGFRTDAEAETPIL